MQYALLAYGSRRGDAVEPMDPAIEEIVTGPDVRGFVRLHSDASATTVRYGEPAMLLTDGPFIDTKEYLAGVILVEADDLDGALAVAEALQATRTGGAIEVRPVLEASFDGA
jgi:hypothetical protein